MEAMRIDMFTVGSLYEPPVENRNDFYPRIVLVTVAINMIFTQGFSNDRR